MAGEVSVHKLDELPREVILIILSHLSSFDLCRNVRATCRLFYNLLANSYLWTSRIQKLGLELDVERSNSCNLNVVLCCIELEEQQQRWDNERLRQYLCVTGHHATIDAIRFISPSSNQRFCISGSRDRSLILWNVDNIMNGMEESSWKVANCDSAHQGWIWSVSPSTSDSFFSCGWDRYVKQWQITEDGLKMTNSAICSGTVLSVLCDGEEVWYSTYDRKVGLLDTRTALSCVKEVKFHMDPVLDLAHLPGSPYIYSSSEDCNIFCIDKRNWKVAKALTLPSFSKTLSLAEQGLLCGTCSGQIALLDAKDLSFINEITVSPVSQIVQVHLTRVSQMCITRKRDIKMYTSGLRPHIFAESNDFDTELAKFDFCNGDLAITCGDGSIMFWLQEYR